MSKKYLSLEEAASLLMLKPDELVRLREKGDIRGFADRGTWKFKVEDVQALVRTRQADSHPEVPLYDGSGSDDLASDADFDQPLVTDEDSRKFSSSDSDVRLVGGADMSDDELDIVLSGDSDIRLVGLDSESEVRLEGQDEPSFSLGDTTQDLELGSDSDVQLIGDDSDSDVQLISGEHVTAEDADTLSDMNLTGPGSNALTSDDSGQLAPFESGHLESPLGLSGDSDVNLLGDDGSESDVSLLADDDAIVLDDLGDDSGHASVLSDESGIALGGDSGMLLAQESGISLEGPSDSGLGMDADDDEGITLALDDDDSGIALGSGESGISLASGDSGISLEAADSGISLEAFDDSGIALSGDDDFGGTIPMMDALGDSDDSPSTQFEIPAMDDDSAYELNVGDDDLEDTRTLELGEVSGEGSLDDAVFEMDDEDEDYDSDSGYVSDAFARDDEVDLDEDAFDDEEEFVEVDGDVFDTVEDGPKFGAAAVRGPAGDRQATVERRTTGDLEFPGRGSRCRRHRPSHRPAARPAHPSGRDRAVPGIQFCDRAACRGDQPEQRSGAGDSHRFHRPHRPASADAERVHRGRTRDLARPAQCRRCGP